MYRDDCPQWCEDDHTMSGNSYHETAVDVPVIAWDETRESNSAGAGPGAAGANVFICIRQYFNDDNLWITVADEDSEITFTIESAHRVLASMRNAIDRGKSLTP